jgi:hypothetical protein
MSDTMAKVKAALDRSQSEFPQSVQIAQAGIKMYASILVQVRAILAAKPAPEEVDLLGYDVSALERIVKVMEEFVASVTKHMSEWTAAHDAHGVDWEGEEHLRFLEDDFARFVGMRERMEGERRLAQSILRPVWVERYGPGAPIPAPVEEFAGPVPKNWAERRALEKAAKKGKGKMK